MPKKKPIMRGMSEAATWDKMPVNPMLKAKAGMKVKKGKVKKVC